jgi:hypothetical protein
MKFINMLCLAMVVASPSLGQTYEGSDCFDDCSGHQAGYEWAAEKGITSEYDCGGNSQFFAEGRLSYIENQDKSDARFDDDGNEIPVE